MSAKQSSGGQPEFRARVSPSLIKRLERTAKELTDKRHHITASLLLYPAYEALMFRACVKALWLRGYKVKDSERFIVGFQQTGNFWIKFFKWCCGNELPFEKDHFFIDAQKFLNDSKEIRGLLIHGVKVPTGVDYGTMKDANKIIMWLIRNPTQVLGEARVKTDDGFQSLGNPFEKLGKHKFRPNLKLLEKISISAKYWPQGIPKRPQMTRRLMNAMDSISSNNAQL